MSDAPVSVSLAAQALTLRWSDGTTTIPAASLRANCRCALCQAARLRGQAIVVDPSTHLEDAVPLGHYALQLRFSDGHERGIYPWALLRELGRPLYSPTQPG